MAGDARVNDGMFQRFTERARQVVNLAGDSARHLRHDHIGTEHLVLGMLQEEEGIAARVLNDLGVTENTFQAHIERAAPPGRIRPMGQIPFTPRGKKVLELSLRDALGLGHNYIGTEHILLGLVRENEGLAMAVLRAHYGLDADTIKNAVIAHLGRPRPKPPADEQPTMQMPKVQPSMLVPIFDKLEQAFARVRATALALEAEWREQPRE